MGNGLEMVKGGSDNPSNPAIVGDSSVHGTYP